MPRVVMALSTGAMSEVIRWVAAAVTSLRKVGP